MIDSVIRQVAIPETIHSQLKDESVEMGKKLSEVYDSILRQFIRSRREVQGMNYYVSPGNSVPTSIWIEKKTLRELIAIGDQDFMPINRVIYTGIIKYVEKNKGSS